MKEPIVPEGDRIPLMPATIAVVAISLWSFIAIDVALLLVFRP
jgi:hypothetical protein